MASAVTIVMLLLIMLPLAIYNKLQSKGHA
jgi:lipopolysaccharide/colanic/teichoic acid biosynthesis glycosyltransferase